MGSIVLYIIEWAFALLVLLAIYKAAFSGTTFYRFNRFYLLGATLLSALLPLVHVTIPDSTPLVSDMSIQDTEFAQELSGTFTFIEEPASFVMADTPAPVHKTSMWAVVLVSTYAVYVLTLIIGWSRGIIRARRFLRGKPRRRLSRTVWLVTHNESYGPFSWMNYIVISDTESGFARRASLRHEFAHVRLMHSIDLIILLACTVVNPVCWLVLQEIKIVHEFEADDEVINRYGIHEQDYQRLLLIRTVGAEAYALASSFNLNIKKRIIMMNKKKTLKRRLIWLLLLIPMLGMTSVLFAHTEKSLNIETFDQDVTMIVRGKVVDEKGKPIPNALITESLPKYGDVVVASRLLGLTDKNGQFSFSTIESKYSELGVSKEGYSDELLKDYYGKNLVITLTKGGERKAGAMYFKQRNLMQLTAKANGKVHAQNGVIDKDVDLAKLKGIVKEFIANPKNNSKLPSIEDYEIDGFKTIQTTVKYVIALERESGATIENRDAAYGVIMNVLYELRDEWCRKEFGTSYEESTPDQQSYARGMYPNKVSMADIMYYYDVNLRIRKSAILAYLDRTESTMDGNTFSQPEEEGTLLGVPQALEKYLDDLTRDGKSRIRMVNMILNENADPDFVQEVKNILRKRNIISIKYMADVPRRVQTGREMYVSATPESMVKVSGNKPQAGTVISGMVKDAEGPMMMVNIYERSSDDRIYSHAITDMNGQFSMKITNPDNKLLIIYAGYYNASSQLTGNHYEITMINDPSYQDALREFERNGGPDENGVYNIVEQMPVFPGGTQGLIEFMRKNLTYPDEAKANNIQGRVMISFVVNEDGHLSDFNVDKSASKALDEEAVRMAKSMPNWKPGVQDGKPVKVRYSIPVNFRMN